MPLQEFKKGIRRGPITRTAWIVAILLFLMACGGLGYGLYSLATSVL